MGKKKDVVRYRCINFGACAKADANEVIEFPAIDVLGGTPPCPCCKQNTLQEIEEKPLKWPLYVGIGVAALAVLGGGGYGIYALTKSPTPKDIVLNHTEKTLFVGDKDTLHATINPEGCEGTLTWKASKDGTLSVTSDGIVTAEKEGTGKVRVLLEGADGLKAVCEYTIKAKPKVDPDTLDKVPPVDPNPMQVDGVTTNTATANLKVGGTQQLTATISPADSKAPITWTSSNESVAMVSSTGLVKALKAGKAVVTAKAGDKTAAVAVTVEKKPGGTGGGTGPLNLGYGLYYGDTKGGKPHGYGKIVFKRTHRIISSKDYIANPGDTYEGEFRNGQPSGGMGYWKHDGDITAVKP